jgi:endonuclease YncB( thermonuclease family)
MSGFSLRSFLGTLAAAVALCFAPAWAIGAPTQPFQKLEGCRLIENKWNDGDSFHVQWQGKEFIFRLYFVDTPEAEKSLAARTTEQATYFGISDEQAIALGKHAATFTTSLLRGKEFTIYTRWRDALGRSEQKRFYAVVMIGGSDLAEQLVTNGLARIYGTRTPLPDGRDSRVYLRRLDTLEKEAKRTAKGGWAK